MKKIIATLIATAVGATFAIAPATAQEKDKGTGLVSRIDSNNPATAAAVAKCEEATGSASKACVLDEKGNVTSTARKADNVKDTTKRAASDTVITTKVKAGLVAEPDLSSLDISVDTNKGVVTLSGTVATKAEADRALKLAKNVEGVTSVKNSIKVK